MSFCPNIRKSSLIFSKNIISENEDVKIDISQLNSGLYFIQILNKDEEVTNKNSLKNNVPLLALSYNRGTFDDWLCIHRFIVKGYSLA